MTDSAPDSKRQRHNVLWYGAWGLVVVFVVYPLSIFPMSVFCDWLEYWGVVSDEWNVIDMMYYPVLWLADESDVISDAYVAVDELFDPIRPPVKPIGAGGGYY